METEGKAEALNPLQQLRVLKGPEHALQSSPAQGERSNWNSFTHNNAEDEPRAPGKDLNPHGLHFHLWSPEDES